ncbi:hypothetical protein HD554DRAFT_2141446 [Boletus coccyginus]|nr:hypothetical protein HD554DRAFT_2141446 [Boletus coccyginus]
MGSDTPLVDILSAHLPPAISSTLPSQSRATLETLLSFALGADCPPRLPDTRHEWSRTQPAALRALRDALGPKAAKRACDTLDTDDPTPKRQKTTEDDVDDPPLFTLPSVSTTSPVRKKVDVTVHARSIRFVNPSTRALEASVPLVNITRAFLLPTRGKAKGHWTVVLLPTYVPDKAKASPPSSQQVIFGLDALTTAPFETTSYPSGTSTSTSTTTVAKGEETASSVRKLLSHIPAPLLEPSPIFFRSACATAKSGQGAAGIDAHLAAKSGTLWFFDAGILWGESKPCEFWAVSDLVPKEGVRLISATGRMCSVILSRRRRRADGEDEGGEDDIDETAFSMVDGREQDPIDTWARHRKHLFGKNTAATAVSPNQKASGSEVARPTHFANGSVKGPAWDDSDPDDDDFEAASSEDLEHDSSDSGSDEEGEGGAGSDKDGSRSEEGAEGSEELEEEEELEEARHPLLRPGAMPRMSKAALDAVVDMVHRDLVDDASEEEDELEE